MSTFIPPHPFRCTCFLPPFPFPSNLRIQHLPNAPRTALRPLTDGQLLSPRMRKPRLSRKRCRSANTFRSPPRPRIRSTSRRSLPPSSSSHKVLLPTHFPMFRIYLSLVTSILRSLMTPFSIFSSNFPSSRPHAVLMVPFFLLMFVFSEQQAIRQPPTASPPIHSGTQET